MGGISSCLLAVALFVTASADSGPVLGLREAIDLVLRHDAGLRQAELQLERARLELEAAIASVSLPSLTFTLTPPTLSTDGWGGDLKGTVGATLSLPLLTSSTISASLDVGLDENSSPQLTGWRAVFSQRVDPTSLHPTSDRLDARRRAVDEAQISLTAKRNALVLETVSTYTNLLAARDQAARVEAALLRAEERLRGIEDLIQRGLRGESDRVDAQLAVLDARIRLDQARSDYEKNLAAFLQGLGLEEISDLSSHELPASTVRTAAEDLLSRQELVDAAVASSSSVRSAERAVAEAEAALRTVRNEAVPALSVDLGLDESGWTVGCRLSFDLFSPDRGARARIAEVDLELARIRLRSAIDSERETVLRLAASLDTALSDLNRLPLEEERWTIREAAQRRKWEAGAVSDGDWEAFLEEQDAFRSDARQRVATLFISYLRYRDVLGLDLEWEGWLQ